MAGGTPRELIDRYVTAEVVELRFADPSEHDRAVDVLDGITERREVLADRILLYVDDADAVIAEVAAREITATTSLTRRSTLEDVFLALTGRTLVE